MSGSGEQDVDSSNVKARNFQTLEGKKQDKVRKAQKEGLADESHGLFHKKGLDSTVSPLTNP